MIQDLGTVVSFVGQLRRGMQFAGYRYTRYLVDAETWRKESDSTQGV